MKLLLKVVAGTNICLFIFWFFYTSWLWVYIVDPFFFLFFCIYFSSDVIVNGTPRYIWPNLDRIFPFLKNNVCCRNISWTFTLDQKVIFAILIKIVWQLTMFLYRFNYQQVKRVWIYRGKNCMWVASQVARPLNIQNLRNWQILREFCRKQPSVRSFCQ